ncbi:MAG: hypothetical protein WC637_08340 [Victivallales bacterium]|jgi:hypothetical protein
MSVSSTTCTAGPYTGNGETVSFPFEFLLKAAAHLIVYRRLTPASDLETLTLNTDYTVDAASLNSQAGGTVTFVTAPASDSKIMIVRIVPATQDVVLGNQGAWFPEVHENEFDLLTMMIQQIMGELARCVKLAIDSEEDPDEYLEICVNAAAAATAAQGLAETAQGLAEAAAQSAQDALDAIIALLANAAQGDMKQEDYDDAAATGSVNAARGLKETAGPTVLVCGEIQDGKYLKRVGNTIVSDTPNGAGNVIGPETTTAGLIAVWDEDRELIEGPAIGNGNGEVPTRPAANKIGANEVTEITAGNGILLDGVLAKDGYLQIPEASAPSTPQSGFMKVFIDNAKKVLTVINSSGKHKYLYGLHDRCFSGTISPQNSIVYQTVADSYLDIPAGPLMFFQYLVDFSTTNVSYGLGLSVLNIGSAGTYDIRYSVRIPSTASTMFYSNQTNFDLGSASPTIVLKGLAVIEGFIVVGTACSIALRYKVENASYPFSIGAIGKIEFVNNTL